VTRSTIPPAPPCAPVHFKRHWWRSVIPGIFFIFAFGSFAYRVPEATGLAVVGACLGVALCALLHGGLIISSNGIAWYFVRPAWRYRVVPWDKVRDVRKTVFGLMEPVRLIVDHDRYELWVWGNPRPDRMMEIEIRTIGYAGGEAIWDTIHRFWRRRDEVDAVKSDCEDAIDGDDQSWRNNKGRAPDGGSADRL
jgi:hypothetical protein